MYLFFLLVLLLFYLLRCLKRLFVESKRKKNKSASCFEALFSFNHCFVSQSDHKIWNSWFRVLLERRNMPTTWRIQVTILWKPWIELILFIHNPPVSIGMRSYLFQLGSSASCTESENWCVWQLLLSKKLYYYFKC